MYKVDSISKMGIMEELKEDIECYINALNEVDNSIDRHRDVMVRFMESNSGLKKYRDMAELFTSLIYEFGEFDDEINITRKRENYTRKYGIKPYAIIKMLNETLRELEKNKVFNSTEIGDVKDAILMYEDKDIIAELIRLEELLQNNSLELIKSIEQGKELTRVLSEFNKKTYDDKILEVDSFCKENIEKNEFVIEIVAIRRDEDSLEGALEFIGDYRVAMFKKWNSKTLTPLIRSNSEVYFSTVKLFNEISKHDYEMYCKDSIKEQLVMVNELLDVLNYTIGS